MSAVDAAGQREAHAAGEEQHAQRDARRALKWNRIAIFVSPAIFFE